MRLSPRGKSIPAPILTLGNPSLQKPLPASPSGMWVAAQTHIAAHKDWNCRRGGLAAVVDDFDERVFMVSMLFPSVHFSDRFPVQIHFFKKLFFSRKWRSWKKHDGKPEERSSVRIPITKTCGRSIDESRRLPPRPISDPDSCGNAGL